MTQILICILATIQGLALAAAFQFITVMLSGMRRVCSVGQTLEGYIAPGFHND
jgi:hypothetical protein